MNRAHRELQLPGARLRYRDDGAGRAVVFVHGWTLDLDVWDPQLALAAQTSDEPSGWTTPGGGGPSLRAQLAALKPVVNGIRVGYKRYYELVAQRKPLDKERAVYENKPVPAWLQTKLDTIDSQFVGLTKVLRGHEQKIGDIQARYQCQRDTYGKLWAGAAAGSSACNLPACAPP